MKITDVRDHVCDKPIGHELPGDVTALKWGPCGECGAKWEWRRWGWPGGGPNLQWLRVRRSSRRWRRVERRRLQQELSDFGGGGDE